MQGNAVVRRQPWRREAVWGGSPRRTAAPNASEPLSKPNRPGERVCERDAQNPTEAGAEMGAAWFKTCQFQVTPETDKTLIVKRFLVLDVTLI